jgi:hypothetical protein
MTRATIVRFRLGFVVDVGAVAGLPGITPLELHGDRLTARVEDPHKALARLRAAGFPSAELEESPKSGVADKP